MKTIYCSRNNELTKVEKIRQNSWVQLINPTLDEIHDVAATLNLPIEFLNDALDSDERPRIEHRGPATLLMLHIPYSDPNVKNLYDDVKYKTIPFGIILTGGHMVTVCKENGFINKDFFVQQGLILDEHNQSYNLFAILNQVAHVFADASKTLDDAISKAEDELSKSYRNQELYTLLYLNESLIYLTTALKNLMHVMNRMQQDNPLPMDSRAKLLFEEALVEVEQVYSITKISQINLNNVMDAYGNIIQNNVSHIVKLLTAVTIVLSIPTLIASIYGMNVPLPYQDEPGAFTAIIISMVVISGVVALFFQKKRYF
ncbi:magnesium transporter CorA family protein [Paenalcaligenes suwonensis]|uniref:magnesium transporter CorA family protein n=1 Tax=Paenalcaligenes suwonensis TaxID=1202713 RepID=UPI00140A027C|nr:magnesium transporter CorA family protein [Paenalcaligenes suwonensis]NHC62098.1 magnesium transporter CorA family protein [Paenalcaligenes suwonensis]